MPYCEFPRDFMLFDVTPVENLFLMEHMPHAPGDYVRVYLYGLMLCRYPSEDASAETVAKALGIKPEEVTEAFRYWERAGLVMRLSDRPPRYQYISPQRALLAGDDPQDGAYQYRDFFQQLQYILGADRLIAPQEQAKAVDWIETLRLPEDVVLAMVEKQVEKTKKAGKSMRYLFADMDKIAVRFADADIRDVQAVEAWFISEGTIGEIAKVVLKSMGQSRRKPGEEELKLAKKWHDEMGLGIDEIRDACKAFARAVSPSFGYLDTVLVGRVNGDSVPYRKEVQEVIVALGAAGRASEAQAEYYAGFLQHGFDHQAVLYAAGQCSQRGKHTFEDLKRRLEAWKREGITTREAAEEYARRREPGERLIAQVYEVLGLSARPTPGDVSAAVKWLSDFTEDVVLFAAERSKGMLRPVGYMTKILREWGVKGVKTVDAARAESASFEKAASGASGVRMAKVNPAQQYNQRKYDDEQLKRRVAVDFSDLAGDEEE